MTNNHFNQAGNVKRLNKEMINTFVVLDELIHRCNFNDDQLKLIKLVQEGYTYQEIADSLGKTKVNVKGRVDKICRDIVKQNNWDWRKVSYTNVLGLKTKRCSMCKEYLPAMDEFFTAKDDSKDKFHPYCNKCRQIVSKKEGKHALKLV